MTGRSQAPRMSRSPDLRLIRSHAAFSALPNGRLSPCVRPSALTVAVPCRIFTGLSIIREGQKTAPAALKRGIVLYNVRRYHQSLFLSRADRAPGTGKRARRSMRALFLHRSGRYSAGSTLSPSFVMAKCRCDGSAVSQAAVLPTEPMTVPALISSPGFTAGVSARPA